MLHTLLFFLLKMPFISYFGSCVIHILYTGCAKIKKKNSDAKGLRKFVHQVGSIYKRLSNREFLFINCKLQAVFRLWSKTFHCCQNKFKRTASLVYLLQPRPCATPQMYKRCIWKTWSYFKSEVPILQEAKKKKKLLDACKCCASEVQPDELQIFICGKVCTRYRPGCGPEVV